MVKKFRRYAYSFSQNARTWRTHRHTHTHTYRQTDTAWRHRPRLHSIARQTLLRAMTTKEKTDSRLSVLVAEMIGISLHAATRHGKIGLHGDLSPCTLLVASHSELGIRNTSMHTEPVCHPRLWCLGHLLTQATSTSAQLPVVSKLYIFEMSWNVWQCCYQPISQYEFRPIKWLLSPKSRVKIGLIPPSWSFLSPHFHQLPSKNITLQNAVHMSKCTI